MSILPKEEVETMLTPCPICGKVPEVNYRFYSTENTLYIIHCKGNDHCLSVVEGLQTEAIAKWQRLNPLKQLGVAKRLEQMMNLCPAILLTLREDKSEAEDAFEMLAGAVRQLQKMVLEAEEELS